MILEFSSRQVGMSFTISEPIKSNDALAARVNRAQEILEEAVGPSSRSTNAAWELVKDAHGRPIVRLTLRDFTDASTQAGFAPDELANERHLYDRSYRIWGDLLQFRSHRQLNLLSGHAQSGE